MYNVTCTGRCDGIGRRSGLKIHRWRQRTGSSPVTGTTSEQTSYRLLRLFYKSQSALTPLLLLSKPNPLSLGFGLGPPLRGGFVLLQENIGRNQPFHIVFSPSEYIPSVDEHKSSGAGTHKMPHGKEPLGGCSFLLDSIAYRCFFEGCGSGRPKKTGISCLCALPGADEIV